MEVMKMDRDKLFWSESGFLTTKLSDIMSRDRLVQIKRYLHFSDDTNMEGKLHRIRFLLDHLREKFQSEYNPRIMKFQSMKL